MKKLVKVLLLLVCAYAPFAQANTVPPSQTNSFYGDASGDMIIAAADIAQMNRWMLGFSYTYDTVQPQIASQNWNTSDVTSDALIAASDIAIINKWMLGFPISVPDKPWVLSNENLPLAGNPVSTPVAFQINLASTDVAMNTWGRTGLPVIAQIDPLGSTTTGSLVGRTCAPIAGSRDQSTLVGAQCALSVSVTDWYGAPGFTKGLTETGTYGLSVIGDSAGDLRIVFSINSFPPGLDIPAVTLGLVITITGGANNPPIFTTAADTTAQEGVAYNYTPALTDPDSGDALECVIGADDTCGGALPPDTPGASPHTCTTYTFTPGAALQTCVVSIRGVDNGVPAESASQNTTVTVNRNPVITSTPFSPAMEGILYTYDVTATDADLPPQVLTCQKSAGDTCGGTFAGCSYSFTPPPGSAGSSCTVGVQVNDTLGGNAVQDSSINIVAPNHPPVVTLSCPISVQETRDIVCTYTTSDPDFPAQMVTVGVNPITDTCGGSIIGGQYVAPTTEAQGPGSCVVGVVGTDSGVPSLKGYDQKTVGITEVNATPTLTLNCPASLGEGTDIVCNMVANDPDIPPNNLVFARHVSDTCGGTIVGSTYTAPTTEAQGPGSCQVVVTVTDNGVPPRAITKGSTVTISEVNENPTVTVDCPASVDELSGTSCTLTAGDTDLPSQALTCSINGSSTCTGLSITGCSSVTVAPQGELAQPISCTVIVDVQDNFSPQGAGQGSDSISITEVNENPTVTVNCPDSVGETSGTSCALTAGDTDLPSQALTCSINASSSCIGLSITGCTSVTVPAQGELSQPISCTVIVDIHDNFSPQGTGQGSDSITITEVNENPSVTVDCPASVDELSATSCILTAGDTDLPLQALTCTLNASTSCVGATITGCTQVDIPAQGEGNLLPSCNVVVDVTDSGSPQGAGQGSDNIIITEVNENPSVVVDCPASVLESASAVCNLTATDPDLPPQALNCSLNASTTCVGATITGCTQVDVPAQGEDHALSSCDVVVDVTDSMAGLGTGSDSMAILEDNQSPSITLNCPVWVNEGSDLSCVISTSDPDLPPDILTLSVDPVTDTCSGTIAGSTYTAPMDETRGGTSCMAGVKVTDNGTPTMSDSASATVAINELNSPPQISLSCPLAVEYPNDIVCDFAMLDNDIPPNILTPFVDGLFDTCGGSIVGSQYIMPTDGVFWPPDSCTVAMGVVDDGVPVLDGYDQALVNIAPADTTEPILSWTLEPGFTSDGVENQYGAAGYGVDNAGLSGDTFNLRVLYTSDLISAPTEVAAAIDLNKDGDYTDPGEVTVLTCDGDCSSNDFSMGRIFKGSVIITRGSAAYAGTGELNYLFSAVDGLGRAATTGAPVSPSIVTVRNNVPELVILGKAALELEPTSGTAGLENVLSLFMEAEGIEDAGASGTPNNYPIYPSPPYPDGNYLDAKWGAAIADTALYAKLFWNGLDWAHHEWSMEYWINTQFMPVADRIIARLDDMEAHPGFDAWSFRMNKSLRIQFNNGEPFMGAVIEIELGLRHSGGEWDGSEVYMLEAMCRGGRAFAEFLMAYGVRSVDSGYGWDSLLAMIAPEDDMLAYKMAELSGTTPLPPLNGIDDDHDGVVDDMGAIGRIFSTFPEFGTYTGGPTGTELEKFRIDVAEMISSLREAVVFVTNETDDQSDDIWLIYRDCGLDTLCPGDPGYPGADEDGTEGNGVYDVVDSNGDRFPDIDWGSNPGNFLPLRMTDAEPLEINHNHAAYATMMNDMTAALNGLLAEFGVPISMPYIPEVNLIAWINDLATGFEASFRGDYGLDWSQEIQSIFSIVNLVYPELGLQAPPGIIAFFDNINIRDELARHWNFKDTFFPAYEPESGQKGDILMGFVGDWSEKFDPVVLAPDGKGCIYKIEPPVALATDPLTGNPTGAFLLGFIDSNSNGTLDLFENIIFDTNGAPIHYLDLNNDGKWNGWIEKEHNTLPGTNGGKGYHNPVYIYFTDSFMNGTAMGDYDNDAFNQYISMAFDFIGGVHFFPPANGTPVAGAVLFDPPLITINPTTAMVSAGAGPVTIHVGGSDPNGNPLVYSLAVGHGATTTTVANVGHITWDPIASLPPGEQVLGPKAFIVTIYDGVSSINGWTTLQFNIVVNP